MESPSDEVHLVFRPLPGSPLWPHRVRSLLKIALRVFRLCCVRVDGLPSDEEKAEAGAQKRTSGPSTDRKIEADHAHSRTKQRRTRDHAPHTEL